MKASVWVVAACLSAQLLSPGAAIAQGKPGGAATKSTEQSPKDKAKNYLKSGDKAANAGQWEDAYADYQIAWTMYQDWEVALAVGRAASKTGHHAEAFERLSFALREAPAKGVSAKQRSEAEAMLADAKAKTGTLTILAEPGGDVLLDRNPAGTTPLAAALRVDPGKHEIEIRRGATGETKSIEVAAGANIDVKFEVAKAAPTATVAPLPTAPPPPAWRTPVVITGGALAVAGLAVGGVFLGISLDKGALKKEEAKKPDGLAATTKAAEAEAQAQNVMLWSFVGAGVALAGTAAVFFATRPASGPKVKASVGVGDRGPTVWLHGEF